MAHLVLHPPGLALLLLLLLTHGLFLSCLLPAHRLFGAALLIGGLAGGLLAGPTLLQFLVALLALLLLRSQAVVAFQFPRCGIFPRRGIGRSRFGEQAAVGGRQRIGATGGALLPFALTSRGFLLPSGVAGCITSLLSGLLFGLASRVRVATLFGSQSVGLPVASDVGGAAAGVTVGFRGPAAAIGSRLVSLGWAGQWLSAGNLAAGIVAVEDRGGSSAGLARIPSLPPCCLSSLRRGAAFFRSRGPLVLFLLALQFGCSLIRCDLLSAINLGQGQLLRASFLLARLICGLQYRIDLACRRLAIGGLAVSRLAVSGLGKLALCPPLGSTLLGGQSFGCSPLPGNFLNRFAPLLIVAAFFLRQLLEGITAVCSTCGGLYSPLQRVGNSHGLRGGLPVDNRLLIDDVEIEVEQCRGTVTNILVAEIVLVASPADHSQVVVANAGVAVVDKERVVATAETDVDIQLRPGAESAIEIAIVVPVAKVITAAIPPHKQMRKQIEIGVDHAAGGEEVIHSSVNRPVVANRCKDDTTGIKQAIPVTGPEHASARCPDIARLDPNPVVDARHPATGLPDVIVILVDPVAGGIEMGIRRRWRRRTLVQTFRRGREVLDFLDLVVHPEAVDPAHSALLFIPVAGNPALAWRNVAPDATDP